MRLGELIGRLERGEAVVAGVLSGTSADGVDVALVRFPPWRGGGLGPPEMIAFDTLAFPEALGGRVRAVLDGEPVGPRGIALLGRDLGRVFGQAAVEVARACSLDLDLVGSHGQTIYHHDGDEPSGPASLQLGDGDYTAHAAGTHVASDFRQGDLAAGGEGAPLSALVDELLFQTVPRPAAILNLGGLANLTVLGADRFGGGALAFDTGPCNSLLDGLARSLLGRPFDSDGETAAAGRPNDRLVRELLGHPFLGMAPPKSTGRDTFGRAYVAEVLALAAEFGVGKADLLASAAAFVARTVQLALDQFAPGIRRLVVAGGGINHRPLLDALARPGWELFSSGEFGVEPEAREALVFAALAARRVLEIPSTHPRATGALEGAVLGKLSAPPATDPSALR